MFSATYDGIEQTATTQSSASISSYYVNNSASYIKLNLKSYLQVWEHSFWPASTCTSAPQLLAAAAVAAVALDGAGDDDGVPDFDDACGDDAVDGDENSPFPQL